MKANLSVMAIFFVLVELFFLVFPGLQPQIWKSKQEKAAYSLERSETHYYEPGLGAVFKPDVEKKLASQSEFTFTVRTARLGDDRIGIRGDPGDGSPWGVMLGDSFIMGEGVEQDDLCAKVIERTTGKKFLNLGQSGFSPNQYELIYRRMMKVHRPKVTVVCIFLNDFEGRPDTELLKDNVTSRWLIDSRSRYARTWLEKNIFTYRLLHTGVSLLKVGGHPSSKAASRSKFELIKDKDDEAPHVFGFLLDGKDEATCVDDKTDPWRAAVQNVEGDLRKLKADAASIGSRLLIVYIPQREQVYTHILGTRYKISPSMDAPGKALEMISEKLNVPYLDLLPVFRAQSGRRLYWRVDGHWNPDGNRLAGETISAWLTRKGWVKD